MEKGYPMIIVLYLDRQMMMNKEIIKPFIKSVQGLLETKEANALAFFLPTDGEERIECINPVQVADADMERINGIIEDLTKNFDIGQGADEGKNDESNEISVDED